jgi:hypothetical protein
MKLWTPFMLTVVFTVGLTNATALADEPAAGVQAEAAEIQLKNGELRRGTIVAVEPGQRVIIIVAGEKSVIPWDEVARIVGGPKEPPPTTQPINPVVVTPAANALPAGAKGVPIVHVDIDWQDAELSRVDGEIGMGVRAAHNNYSQGIVSKYLCQAPCDKAIDGREGHRFFVTAPGMFPSPHFRLDNYEGHVTARIHGTSYGRFIGGVVAIGTGSVFTLGGAMFFGMSFLNANERPSAENPNPERAAADVRNAGLVFGAIGITGVIAGIALLSGGTTRVEIIKGSRDQSALVLDGGVLRF